MHALVSTTAETHEECAPSLSESRIEYSLSVLLCAPLRSYSSNLRQVPSQPYHLPLSAIGRLRDMGRIIQLRDPRIRNRKSRVQNQVDQSVDMALLEKGGIVSRLSDSGVLKYHPTLVK